MRCFFPIIYLLFAFQSDSTKISSLSEVAKCNVDGGWADDGERCDAPDVSERRFVILRYGTTGSFILDQIPFYNSRVCWCRSFPMFWLWRRMRGLCYNCIICILLLTVAILQYGYNKLNSIVWV